MTTEVTKEIINKDRWKNRRAMTWIAVAHLILFIPVYLLALAFLDPSTVKLLSEFNGIAITILGVDASIILAYFGLVTKDDMELLGKVVNK